MTEFFKFSFSFSLFFCAVFTPAGSAFAQTTETFAEQIRSGSTEQKREALLRIRNLRSPEASRTALPALRDASEIVRATAASSVIFLPKEEAFDALLPNLNDKSEFVRRETAYALGRIQNPRAVAPLIQTFQKDQIPEVRSAAVIALGQIGDASAVAALTQVLRAKTTGENEFLRRSAARSVGQIAQFIQTGETAVLTPESFLPEKFKSQTHRNYRNLASTSPEFQEAAAALIALLKDANESADARREAAFALGAIADSAALPVLEANLAAKDYYLAEISREALQKIKSAADSK